MSHARTGDGPIGAATAPPPGTRVVAILLLVYVLNFLDRQMVGILAGPIKRDLSLSDTQLGLMGGLAFAIFYTTLGLPVAWMADRRRRVPIVATALLLWSGFTALCGAAQGFTQLFLCRMGVGVGEAGSVAPSYSIVADTFPEHRRGRAFAVLLFGVPLGSALGILIGGTVAAALDWRDAFVIIGMAGIAAVPLVAYGVPEPARGLQDQGAPRPAEAPTLPTVARTIARKPSFWFLSLGAAASSIISYGSMFWLPSLFQRSLGLSLFATACFYGSVVLVGGVAGVALGGWLVDRSAARSRRAYALVGAVLSVAAAPVYALALGRASLAIAWPLLALAQALSMAWMAPSVTAIQHIVPPSMRATASAAFQLILNLIGLGCGTVAIGVISDRLAPALGQDALRWSVLLGLFFYIVAGLLFWLASRWIERDWEAV